MTPHPPRNQSLQDSRGDPSIRNRVMLALAYDAALRREELCTLQTKDLDLGGDVVAKIQPGA